MTEFEEALRECLDEVEQGNASVEECLRRYPKYAQQLEPVLLTSAYLQYGSEARPSAAFKARVRSKLVQQMYARPRKAARPSFMFVRMAVSLAALVLALLVAGTAYAQGVLPGNAFYVWKLASENVWRASSSDVVGVDLMIAERRMDELMAVRNDPALYAQALKAYLEVSARLRSETDTQNEERILTVLDAQVEELNQSGISLPSIDQNVPLPSNEPTNEPTLIPGSTVAATPMLVLETPQVNPTALPNIVPTLQVPPEIVPTRVAPPKIIPTLEIPPPIR